MQGFFFFLVGVLLMQGFFFLVGIILMQGFSFWWGLCTSDARLFLCDGNY